MQFYYIIYVVASHSYVIVDAVMLWSYSQSYAVIAIAYLYYSCSVVTCICYIVIKTNSLKSTTNDIASIKQY